MAATTTTTLEPETLFDLLADPRDYSRWTDIHGFKAESIDAPPGSAVAGTEILMRGSYRSIPYTCRTTVVRADRPTTFETRSEITLHSRRSLVKSMTSSDRYTLEPHGSGSTVTLESRFARSPWMRFFLMDWFLDLYARSFGSRMFRKALEELMRSAERYAAQRRA
jgi:hypothetical protein